MLQHAVLDHRQGFAGDAFTIEGARRGATDLQRIIGDVEACLQDLLAHLVAQEGGLAGDRGTIDGAGDCAREAARNARVEHNREIGGRRDLPRVQAADRPLGGAAADFFRAIELGEIETAVEVVVTLHLGALAGDDADRAGETRAGIAAGKAVRGDKHEATHAGRSTGAERIADTVYRTGHFFHGERAFAQLVARHFRIVEELKIRDVAGKIALVGETGEGIFGGDLGHGNRTLGKRREVEAGIGRNARHLAADEDAERKVVALGRFGRLDLAETDADALGAGAHDHRISLVGTRLYGEIDKLFGAF